MKLFAVITISRRRITRSGTHDEVDRLVGPIELIRTVRIGLFQRQIQRRTRRSYRVAFFHSRSPTTSSSSASSSALAAAHQNIGAMSVGSLPPALPVSSVSS